MEQRSFITVFVKVRHLFLPQNTLNNPSTDVSENPTASTIRVQKSLVEEKEKRVFTPVQEKVDCSGKTEEFYKTTRRHIPEESNFKYLNY